MANHNHKVTTTITQAQLPGGGTAAPPLPGAVPGRFTDKEMAAAQHLVLLSESSSEDVAPRAAASSASSSSSLPSVSNGQPQPPAGPTMADEDEEDEEDDGVWAGPTVRRWRYRAICSLYAATAPIEAAGEKDPGAAQRRKRSRR